MTVTDLLTPHSYTHKHIKVTELLTLLSYIKVTELLTLLHIKAAELPTLLSNIKVTELSTPMSYIRSIVKLNPCVGGPRYQ